MIATRCAQKTWNRKWGRYTEASSDWIEDAASDVLVTYYGLSEWDRPKNEHEFELFAYQGASKTKGREEKRAIVEIGTHGKRVSTDHREENDGDVYADWLAFHHSGSLSHAQKPTQELYLYLLDVMRSLDAAPEEIRRAANRLADSGSIIEFARDNKISLFDAMNEQKRLKTITKRIAEDLADEKKFG